MNHEINRLLNFAQQQGLLDQADRVYGANLLLAALQLEEKVEDLDVRAPGSWRSLVRRR